MPSNPIKMKISPTVEKIIISHKYITMPYPKSKAQLSAIKRRSKRPVRKKTKRAILTKDQAKAVKKLIGEDIAVKDCFRDNTNLGTTMSLQGAANGNAFFSLTNTQAVVGNVAQPAERNGDDIKALNMDLRVNVTFTSIHQQSVRLMLLQFQDTASADIAQVLDATAQDANQPFNVVRGFRLRTPDCKYKILADKVITNTTNAGKVQEGSLIGRVKYCRFYHKFKDSESNMNYVEGIGQGSGPTTNSVYLYACYASPKATNGTNLPDTTAPFLSFACRQRYMK